MSDDCHVNDSLSSSGITGQAGWSGSGGGPLSTFNQLGCQSADLIKAPSNDNRDTPDISMPAAPAIASYFYNQWLNGTGTSFAAPMVAGLMADMFQYNSRDPLMACDLYDLGYNTTPYGYNAYSDITTGNNGKAAGIGWDYVTGIGTPLAWNLARALRNYYTGNLSYYLTMSASPSSGGSVSPGSGWHSSGHSAHVTATLRATPNAGYGFVTWAGTGNGSTSGTSNPATITMSSNVTETAIFQSYLLTYYATPTNGGSVSVTPVGVGGAGQYYYAPGSKVNLTANEGSGYSFQYWLMYRNGVYLGKNYNSKIAITMNGNYIENAYFTPSGGGGPGCVVRGTMISLSNGTQVAVQNLKPGMSILSYDVNSRTLVPTTVSSNEAIQVTQVTSINNGQLYMSGTYDQPIYVRMQNGTQTNILLGRLAIGMKLYRPLSNSWVTLSSLAPLQGSFTVYDLRTSNGDNYIANMFIPSPK